MTRMMLQTFLANDLADSLTKRRRLGKYSTPGGGDYWWGAKEATRRMFNNGESYDEAVGAFAKMNVPHQHKDNQELAHRMYLWKLKNPDLVVLSDPPPTAEIAGPKGKLIVKLEPNFVVKRKGKIEAYVLWTFKDLRLTPQVAGIGVHLLELALQHDEYDAWRFYILDAVTLERFGHSKIVAETARAALFALRTQEEILLDKSAA